MELEYDFHDALVRSVRLPRQGRVDLQIDLYPVFYPERPTVQVSLLDILNWDSSEKFFRSLEDDDSESMFRVDAIYFDAKRKSKPDDVWLRFEVDHAGAHTVHCRGLRVDEVPPAPPEQIDGARVLLWAWSGSKPFGEVPVSGPADTPAQIHGLAICRYDAGQVYRFACNREWESEQDSQFETVGAAMAVPKQYAAQPVRWRGTDAAGTG